MLSKDYPFFSVASRKSKCKVVIKLRLVIKHFVKSFQYWGAGRGACFYFKYLRDVVLMDLLVQTYCIVC